MKTTNIILSVIAVAVIITASVVGYRFYQQEADKLTLNAISRVQADIEQKQIKQVQQEVDKQNEEQAEKSSIFYTCLAEYGFSSAIGVNDTILNKCN